MGFLLFHQTAIFSGAIGPATGVHATLLSDVTGFHATGQGCGGDFHASGIAGLLFAAATHRSGAQGLRAQQSQSDAGGDREADWGSHFVRPLQAQALRILLTRSLAISLHYDGGQ
jgi:hypothetical protein